MRINMQNSRQNPISTVSSSVSLAYTSATSLQRSHDQNMIEIRHYFSNEISFTVKAIITRHGLLFFVICKLPS